MLALVQLWVGEDLRNIFSHKWTTAIKSSANKKCLFFSVSPSRPSESDAQQRPQQVGASRGPTGLSKSRTVDAFNQGPPGRPTPGRSPSSLSLFENRFRQEPKDPETKSSGMFGSSFLSGANPLSAVSSMTSSVSSSISSIGDNVTVPKFGLFGDEEDGDAPETKQGGKPPGKGLQQGPGPKGPQQGGPQKQGQGPPGQGPKPGQGPPGQGPRQGQGPPGQGAKPGQGPPGQGPPGQGPRQGQGPPGQGPKPGQGPPGQGPPGQGPRQGQGPPGQGPKPGQGPPGQGPPGQAPRQGQGPPGPGAKQGGPPQQGPGKPGPKQQGPPGHGAHPGEPAKSGGPPGQQGAGKPGGGLCPLCKTTQLNTGSKDPPNYNNCTECKNQVCSLCGFSPPDSAVRQWSLSLFFSFQSLKQGPSKVVWWPLCICQFSVCCLLTCMYWYRRQFMLLMVEAGKYQNVQADCLIHSKI